MTGIEWTDDTWNPVTGCTRVSEWCRHCYIERTPPFRMAGRRVGDPIRLHPERLDAPLHWEKPRRVFVNSLSDLFHEDVPDAFIDQVFATMFDAGRHTYQILTKRIDRASRYLSPDNPRYTAAQVFNLTKSQAGRFDCDPYWPLDNVWLGVSVEDQTTADERIPILLQTPVSVRFVSAEPLLSSVRLQSVAGLDWVIVGGESGPHARPCTLDWIRSVVRQCQAASVPVFVKQMGSHVVDRNDAGFDGDSDESWPMDTRFEQEWSERNYQGMLGRVRLHDRHGGDPAEWTADLRVREWPATGLDFVSR